MTSSETYFDFIESLATKHKSILHTPAAPRFFRTDIDEFDSALRTKANFPLITTTNPLISVDAKNTSNLRAVWSGSILFLDRIRDKGDFQERNAKEAALQQIAKDFLLLIILESQRRDGSTPIQSIADADFGMELVPNRYTSLCGVLLTFEWNESIGEADLSRWNDIDPINILP